MLKSMEDEESKKIAVDINIMERKAALDHCAALGFHLANTPGVDEIKPRARGAKDIEIDFDTIDIGESRSDVKPKQKNKRVNLGDAPEEIKVEYIAGGQRDDEEDGDVEEYIKLDVGEGQAFETLNYNHRLRRKLRRAIDNAEIRKEMLVRQRALEYYRGKDMETPWELNTPHKPINVKGQRILENGTYETSKQDRVRTRMELVEFNTQMRVLRKQAKEAAIYAGLRKHADLMGKISANPVANYVGQQESKDSPQAGAIDPWSESQNFLPARSSAHAYAGTRRIQDSDIDSSNGSSDQSASLSESSFSGSSS